MLSSSVKSRRTRQFLARVLRSPRLLINAALVTLAYRLRLRRTVGQPVVVDIEPTNACNFRCPHCQVTHADWIKRHMSPEQYDRCLTIFSKALRVKLQGMGEPFLNKALPDYIDKACSRGHWCEVISNGSLLDRRPLDRVLELSNFQLTISFDAPDKATFERIRPGSNFEGIVENIRRVTQLNSTNLAAWMVVNEDNQHLIVEVIELLGRLGVRSLGLQMVVIDYGKAELRDKTVDKRARVNDRRAFYDGLRDHARHHGVELDIADRLYSRKRICPWPWQGVFIDTQGDVVPCCRIGDASVCNMGNINETSFADIWNSPTYREFRQRHRDLDIPEICTSCYEA